MLKLRIFAFVIIIFILGITTSFAQDDTFPVITVDNANQLTEVNVIGGDQGKIAVSSDDRWLAVSGSRGVWLFDLTDESDTGRLLGGHTEPINALDFSNDSTVLASASDDDTIRLWSLPDGEELMILEGHTDDVLDVDFHLTDTFLVSASGGDDDTVRIWDLESGEEFRQYSDVAEGHAYVNFLDNTPLLLSGTLNSSVGIWNLNDDAFLLEFNSGFNSHVTSIASSPTQPKFAVSLFSGRVIIGDIEAGDQQNLDHHSQGVREVVFSPDGSVIASVGMDDLMIISDVNTGEILAEYELEDFGFSVAFSSDGQRVFVATDDGKVNVIDVFAGEIVAQISLAFPSIRQISYSPDGRYIAAVTDEDRLARVFDAQTGEQIAVLSGHIGRTFAITFSPDGSLIASVGGGGDVIRLWETENFTLAGAIAHEDDSIYSVAFSPDGSVLATGSSRGQIRLFDHVSTEQLAVFDNEDSVWGLSFSPDGTLLAAPNGVWNIINGEKLPITIDRFASVSFSPLSDLLVTSDTFINISDTEAVTPPTGYVGLNNTKVAFSPDGTLVALANDEDIDIVDINLQAVVARLEGHTSNVQSIAFSPDGTMLISGGSEGTIRQWAVRGDAGPAVEPTPIVANFDGLVLDFLPTDVPAVTVSDNAITLDNVSDLKETIVRSAISHIRTLAISNDGSHIAINGRDGAFLLVADNSENPIPLSPEDSDIFSASLVSAFSHDGSVLAVSYGFEDEDISSGAGLILWDITGDTPMILYSTTLVDRIFSLAFNADGSMLATGLLSEQATILDLGTLEFIASTQEPLFGAVVGVQFSNDGTILSVADTAGNKALFNSADGSFLGGFNSGIAIPLLYSADNSVFLSAEQEGFLVRSLSGDVLQENAYPEELRGDILATDLSSGQLVVAGANIIWFLDYQTGEISQTITGFDTGILTGQVTADGSHLIAVTGDNLLRIWNTNTGEEISQQRLGYNDILAETIISPDGRFFILENDETSLWVFDGVTGELLRELVTDQTAELAFVPNTSILASSNFASKIEFWDAESGEMLASVPTDSYVDISFSNDGVYLATRSLDTLRLQNIRTGQILFDDVPVHLDRFNDIDFSLSENLVATAGEDGTVKLWNLETAEQVGLIRAHPEGIRLLSFSPNGSALATMANDGVRLWDYSEMSAITEVFFSGFDFGFGLNGLYFSQDGTLLFVHKSRDIIVLDANTGVEVARLAVLDGTSLLSSDGATIVVAEDAGNIRRYALNGVADNPESPNLVFDAFYLDPKTGFAIPSPEGFLVQQQRVGETLYVVSTLGNEFDLAAGPPQPGSPVAITDFGQLSNLNNLPPDNLAPEDSPVRVIQNYLGPRIPADLPVAEVGGLPIAIYLESTEAFDQLGIALLLDEENYVMTTLYKAPDADDAFVETIIQMMLNSQPPR